MDIITTKTNGHIQDFIRRRNEIFDQATLDEFSRCANDQQRYSVVHGKTSSMDLIECPEDQKSLEKALEFKQKGNGYFKDANWIDAMKCYTLSYINTPHDKSEWKEKWNLEREQAKRS